MIQRLSAPALSFKANGSTLGAKDAYERHISENAKKAEQQNALLGLNTNTSKASGNISMQGQNTGEKLNILA